MRTKIDLLSSGIIDLTDDVPYSLNFVIADIRTPDKRDSSYSKTIKIAGSKNNDVIFQHIWNVDMDCNFNPNKKAECILYIDELPQLQGYLQLLKVIRNDGGKLEYEVSIKGQVGSIFTKWGEKELTDLDYSDLNHSFDKATQKATWTASVGIGYVYTLIDLGMTNGLTYDVQHFIPSLYVIEYIDRFFKDAGYKYNSVFFNSDFFKRLIVPFNQSEIELSTSEIVNMSSYVNDIGQTDHLLCTLSPTTYTDEKITIFPYTTVVSDPNNFYNFTTDKRTIIFDGYYDIYATVGLDDSMYTLGGKLFYIYSFIVLESAGNFYNIASGYFDSGSGGSSNTGALMQVSNMFLRNGDKLHIGLKAGLQNDPYTNTYYTSGDSLYVKEGTTHVFGENNFDVVLVNNAVIDGNAFVFNNAIPKKIKIKDFFSSIIKMFNLYIETDKYNEKILNIEPRDDFYSSGVVVDWTSKLDVSKELILEPMGQLDSVRYKYTYKDDVDYWNKKYKDSYRQVYSEENYDVDNDFLKNTNTTDIIFSPTPLVNVPLSSDRNIPQIVSLTSGGSLEKMKSYNIRILYYGGVKTTSSAWKYTSLISGTTIENNFPYCGMLDDTASPTLSLDFGVPFSVYYSATSYTNNNLFNKYYSRFIEEIINKDSKIVTGYFALNPIDILKLDFRNEFYVNGYYLRLNKIFDYNPVVSQMTKCEFIKIKRANSFVGESKDIGGSDIKFIRDISLPISLGGVKPHTLNGNIVKDGNYVDSTVRGVIVTGSNNLVGAGCENITLLNCSGVTVMPNVSGATVMNSSGVVVAENDKIYINSSNFNGGLPSVLAVDAKTNEIPITSNDGFSQLQLLNGYTFVGNTESGLFWLDGTGLLTDSADFSLVSNGTNTIYTSSNRLHIDNLWIYFDQTVTFSMANTFSMGSGGVRGFTSDDTAKTWSLTNSGGTGTSQTSGTLTIGVVYTIGYYNAGDDFLNCGAPSNTAGVQFVATNTTPTNYTHSSTLYQSSLTFLTEGIDNITNDAAKYIYKNRTQGLVSLDANLNLINTIVGSGLSYNTSTNTLSATGGGGTVTSVASTYSIVSTDFTIICNGTFNVTLPDATSNVGRYFNIKNVGAGVITINTISSQTIDGSLTNILAIQYLKVTIQSDGSNWIII